MITYVAVALATAVIVSPAFLGWGVLAGRRSTRALEQALEREDARLTERTLELERQQGNQAKWYRDKEAEIKADLLARETALLENKRILVEKERHLDAQIEAAVHKRVSAVEQTLQTFRAKWVEWAASDYELVWENEGCGVYAVAVASLLASRTEIVGTSMKSRTRLVVNIGDWTWVAMIRNWDDWTAIWNDIEDRDNDNSSQKYKYSFRLEALKSNGAPPEVPPSVGVST